jgi:hypothetical protein
MATTGSGPGSSGQGTSDWSSSAGQQSGGQKTRDRRAAGNAGAAGSGTATTGATGASNMGATSTGTGETQSSGIAQTIRDTTYRSIDGQKSRASDTLGSLAGAVRGMSQPLRDGGQGQIADYVNKAADGIERWASQLRQQDLEDAVRAVEQFARRQPAMFLGLAFGAGLVAARFLKSSSQDSRYERQYGRDFDTPSGMVSSGYGASGLRTTAGVGAGASGTGTSDFSGTRATSGGEIPRLSSDIRPAGEVL